MDPPEPSKEAIDGSISPLSSLPAFNPSVAPSTWLPARLERIEEWTQKHPDHATLSEAERASLDHKIKALRSKIEDGFEVMLGRSPFASKTEFASIPNEECLDVIASNSAKITAKSSETASAINECDESSISYWRLKPHSLDIGGMDGSEAQRLPIISHASNDKFNDKESESAIECFIGSS